MNTLRFAAYSNTNPQMISFEKDEMMKRAPDSAWMLDYWDLTDCLVEGKEALIKEGERFLPKFLDESKEDYNFRLKMTKFTNIYRDIIESLSSKPFEEETGLVEGEDKPIPEQIKEFIENVDGSGNNLTVFASLTFFNGLNSCIDWICVDYPEQDASIRTAADQKKAGVRPFWTHVLGRNVLEAKSRIINGKETLCYMRIYEPGEPDHVRVYERSDDGLVTWKLFEKITDQQTKAIKFVQVKSGIITIGVIPLVPFATGRRDGKTFKFFPPFRDAADLQVELYEMESDLKFAKKMTAFPMLAAVGVTPEMEADGKTLKKVGIGPKRMLYAKANATGQHGDFKYIEPAATSLQFLASDVKDTIQQLRELGRLPLTAQSGNLTTITAAVAAGKAKTAVGAWALLLKDALENAFVLTCMWYGIKDTDYSAEVSIYMDFDNFAEGNSDLEHLRSMRESGDLSQETFWIESKRRRVLSAEFDANIEIARLLKEIPGEEGGRDLDPEPPIKPEPNPEPLPGNVEL